MSKQDQILDYIIEIKSDIGGIKQHLKDINGKVKTNEEDLKKMKGKVAYVSGAIASIGTLIGFFLNKLFN